MHGDPHSVSRQSSEVGLVLAVLISLAFIINAIAINIHIGSPEVCADLRDMMSDVI